MEGGASNTINRRTGFDPETLTKKGEEAIGINMLTEHEARKVAIAAAEEVLARRPVPTSVTLKQAAEMLGISPNTARKLRLPRNSAGLIPYEAVLEARAASR